MTAHRLALLLAALGAAGCFGGGWGTTDDDDLSGSQDDDDLLDDDDAGDDDVAPDDDDGEDTGPDYPDEEEFFGLAVGHRWRYDEVVGSDITPLLDDVLVEVKSHVPGDELVCEACSPQPDWGPEVGAWEVKVDRLYGDDVTHFYGLRGDGTLRWLQTRVHTDFFEFDDHPGDGSIVMTMGPDLEAMIGGTFDAAMYLADVDALDFSATADTIETFLYGEDREAEALGLLVSEGSTVAGLQYFKPQWGLLGMEVEYGGASYRWTITECDACPASSGL